MVQSEIKKRRPIRRQLNNNSPFAAKIICGSCDGYYGSKVWHSNSKYRNTLWQCNRKYDGGEVCAAPHIREEELKSAFIRAFNQILGNKERYIAQFEEWLPLLADTSELDRQRDEAQEACAAIMESMLQYMDENAKQVQNQAEYERRFQKMGAEYKTKERKVAKLKDAILEQKARKEKINGFLGELRKAESILTDFDESLWHSTIEAVKVHPDKSMTFVFRDGSEVLITPAAGEK